MNSPQRFLALDVLRGMTVCFMIIVNTPGGPAYPPLNHAHWNADYHLEFNSFSHTRIMGVLQRIALGYFFAALMIRYLSPVRVGQLSWYFLIIYWAILLLFGDRSDPYNMLTNAGTRLDLWLFGPVSYTHLRAHETGRNLV